MMTRSWISPAAIRFMMSTVPAQVVVDLVAGRALELRHQFQIGLAGGDRGQDFDFGHGASAHARLK